MQPTPTSIEALDKQITQPTTKVVDAIASCPGDQVVIGAGGKMGFHVCRMLQAAGERLNAATRIIAVSRFTDPKVRRKFESAGFDVIAADTSRESELAGLPDAANVIYLAGVKFGTSSSEDQLQALNVEMPRLVAERYRHSRIVALSTGCVYSFTTPSSGGSKETSEMNPPGAYAASCIGRERAFTEVSQRYGTPCVLVRLNYSIDLRYGVLVDIAKQVAAGRPVNVDTGYVNVIWQGDAVAQILQCLPHASSPPFVINITGPDILSVREIAQRFAGLFDREVSYSGREADTAWLSDSSLSQRLFGRPRTDVETMIRWIGDWLQRGQPTLDKPTQFENREGNY